jgi:4'-phosphopantetheinyl transferase
MTGDLKAYWLEQTNADVPTGTEWLSVGEMSCLARLCFPKRRADWILGRWTAKRGVISYLNLPFDFSSLRDIEIRAAPSGVPEVFLFNQRVPVGLSLSHRAGKAFCVVGESGVDLGCDLELVESREDSFLTDFFTEKEQTLVDRAPAYERSALVTLLWSAKESALKALKVGLRLHTASLEVSFTDPNFQPVECSPADDCPVWSPLSVRRTGPPDILAGWWRCANDMVRTVVSNPRGVGWDV